MTFLKRIWTNEDEDPEVKTLYQYVVHLRDRVEETCKMAKEELAKVQVRNQKTITREHVTGSYKWVTVYYCYYPQSGTS